MSEELTEKQKAFCREYLKDFNATKAAIRAGYSEESARQIASENLSKHDVQQCIQSLADKINTKTENKIERIITELQLIAFGSLRDVAEWDAGGLSIKNSNEVGDSARLVSEVTESRTDKSTNVKIKMHDKLKALELLGKYHKMFTDKIEQETNSKIEIRLAYKED
jgi:phage terminase small subunit